MITRPLQQLDKQMRIITNILKIIDEKHRLSDQSPVLSTRTDNSQNTKTYRICKSRSETIVLIMYNGIYCVNDRYDEC